MIRRPPRSTRTDTRFPYTTLFGSEHLVQVRDLPDPALAPGVVGAQRRAFDPAFDDRVAARPGLRVVGQPDPRAGGRDRDEGGQAGIERVIVDAERQQRSEEHTYELQSLMSIT